MSNTCQNMSKPFNNFVISYGIQDLEEKLNEVNETVTSKLQELARSSAEAASSVAASSQDAPWAWKLISTEVMAIGRYGDVCYELL